MASDTPPIPKKVAAVPAGAMPGGVASASKPAMTASPTAGGGAAPSVAAQSIDNVSAEPEINFWQQKWAQRVLPFTSSILLHAGIILLGLLTIQAGRTILRVMKQQIIIPDAAMTTGEPGGIPHPGLGGDPDRDARQDQYKDVPLDSTGWASKKGNSNAAQGSGSSDLDSDNAFTVGPNTGFGKGIHGLGGGDGQGAGSGNGDGSGPLAPFGVPGGGGGIGPRSNFFGTGGNARLIAYVCDASGSMMSKFDYLRFELQKSIEHLNPMQGFNVIFFQETSADAVGASGLLLATPTNKQKAVDYVMRRMPRGSTDPIPALDIAFKQKPELIYLLTDGDFPDNKAVVDFIHKTNADHKVKINTIAFIDPGEEYEKILKQIATENGGTFKFVSEEDLKN